MQFTKIWWELHHTRNPGHRAMQGQHSHTLWSTGILAGRVDSQQAVMRCLCSANNELHSIAEMPMGMVSVWTLWCFGKMLWDICYWWCCYKSPPISLTFFFTFFRRLLDFLIWALRHADFVFVTMAHSFLPVGVLKITLHTSRGSRQFHWWRQLAGAGLGFGEYSPHCQDQTTLFQIT